MRSFDWVLPYGLAAGAGAGAWRDARAQAAWQAHALLQPPVPGLAACLRLPHAQQVCAIRHQPSAGNAVTVPVARWLGERLANPYQAREGELGLLCCTWQTLRPVCNSCHVQTSCHNVVGVTSRTCADSQPMCSTSTTVWAPRTARWSTCWWRGPAQRQLPPCGEGWRPLGDAPGKVLEVTDTQKQTRSKEVRAVSSAVAWQHVVQERGVLTAVATHRCLAL